MKREMDLEKMFAKHTPAKGLAPGVYMWKI